MKCQEFEIPLILERLEPLAVLQARRLGVKFLMRLLNISIDLILQAALWSWALLNL
jgi:hypothetical protein